MMIKQIKHIYTISYGIRSCTLARWMDTLTKTLGKQLDEQSEDSETTKTLEEQLEDLETTKENMMQGRYDLLKDKKLSQDYEKFLERKDNNQTPTQEQIEATDYITDEYEGFLEEVESSEDEAIPMEKERQKASELTSYFEEELCSNKKEQYKNQLEQNCIVNLLREEGKLPKRGATLSSIDEVLLTPSSIVPSPMPQSSAISSSEKKPSTSSPIDYVDSLHKDYSPFDDLGED